MADILDELESDYRGEQLRLVARRYAGLAIGLLVACLAGVGGWQLWQQRRAQDAMTAATGYLALSHASEAAAANGASDPAMAPRFGAFAANAPAGYRTLARLQQAAALAGSGQIPAAQAIWDSVSTDPQADLLLRQLASLLWVQRGLDTADPAALRTRLVSIVAGDNPYRSLGTEAQALLALRLHQPDTARPLLRRLSADPSTPEGVRGRALALLSRLGG